MCSVIPPLPKVTNLLLDMANGLNPLDRPSVDLKLLQDRAPIIFAIIKENGNVPENIRLLLKDMVDKAYAPFRDRNVQQLDDFNESDACYGYLPCLPQRVARGTYIMDNKNTPLGDCYKLGRSYKRHGTLIPGIFCMFCPHGEYSIG